jgi:hypothetical protein
VVCQQEVRKKLLAGEVAEAITAEGGGWELPERIEDPDAYEAARADSLTEMRPTRRPA